MVRNGSHSHSILLGCRAPGSTAQRRPAQQGRLLTVSHLRLQEPLLLRKEHTLPHKERSGNHSRSSHPSCHAPESRVRGDSLPWQREQPGTCSAPLHHRKVRMVLHNLRSGSHSHSTPPSCHALRSRAHAHPWKPLLDKWCQTPAPVSSTWPWLRGLAGSD